MSSCTVHSEPSSEDRSLQNVELFGRSERDSLTAPNDHANKPCRAFNDNSIYFCVVYDTRYHFSFLQMILSVSQQCQSIYHGKVLSV